MAQQEPFILSTLEKNGIQKVVLNKPAKKNAISAPVNKYIEYFRYSSFKVK